MRSLRRLLIAALVLVGLVISALTPWLLLGYATGIAVLAPWSRQYFKPVDSINAYDLSPHAIALEAQSSPCNLASMNVLRGAGETRYDGGPEYTFALTPVSLITNPLTAWSPTQITVELNGQPLLVITGDPIGNAVPTAPLSPHPTSDEINIYPPLLVNLGDLETVQPGDTLTVTVHAKIFIANAESPCHEVRRFEFQCFYESGVFKTYR